MSLAIPLFVQSKCYLFCGYDMLYTGVQRDYWQDWISVDAMAFGLKTYYLSTNIFNCIKWGIYERKWSCILRCRNYVSQEHSKKCSTMFKFCGIQVNKVVRRKLHDILVNELFNCWMIFVIPLAFYLIFFLFFQCASHFKYIILRLSLMSNRITDLQRKKKTRKNRRWWWNLKGTQIIALLCKFQFRRK